MFWSGIKMALFFQSQCQTLEMRVSGSWRLLVCHRRHGFTQSWALGSAPQNGGTLRSCSRQVDGNHFHERSSIRMRRCSLSSMFFLKKDTEFSILNFILCFRVKSMSLVDLGPVKPFCPRKNATIPTSTNGRKCPP